MPISVDPENRRVTDDLYAAGRAAFAAGASVMENPLPSSGNYGRAWFAGWLDALADRLDGADRASRAYPMLLRGDRADIF
jgi:ribosome modulation factor